MDVDKLIGHPGRDQSCPDWPINRRLRSGRSILSICRIGRGRQILRFAQDDNERRMNCLRSGRGSLSICIIGPYGLAERASCDKAASGLCIAHLRRWPLWGTWKAHICSVGVRSSIADRRSQERNGQRLKEIASHGSATLFVAPCIRIASIDGRRESCQEVRVSLRLLCLASHECQRQSEQGPTTIRAGRGCLRCLSVRRVAFAQGNLA